MMFRKSFGLEIASGGAGASRSLEGSCGLAVLPCGASEMRAEKISDSGAFFRCRRSAFF